MNKIRGWLRGWFETIRIRFLEPALYKDLTAAFDIAEFEEVKRPERDG